MTDVVVTWCRSQDARIACQRWHYSRGMPTGRVATFGVWEDRAWIGAVVYAGGANHHAGWAYGCAQGEYAELVRVALRAHVAPVSQIVMASLRSLHDHAPGIRLILSYADPLHGHRGGIYQAMNFTYLGLAIASRKVRLPDGSLRHQRGFTGHSFDGLKNSIPDGAEWESVPAKHKYALGLTRPMARQLRKLAQPYPRGGSVEGDTPDLRSGEASSIPAHRSMEVAT